MALLTEDEVRERLAGLDGWGLEGDEIAKVYENRDFVDSLMFVNRVGFLAEKAGHHPDVLIQWNKVKLNLATHSEGGLTEKDFALAAQIDSSRA